MLIAVIIIIIFLLGLGGGAIAWFMLRQRQAAKSQEATRETAGKVTLPFRWSYIIAPLAVFILSLILIAYFAPHLPNEVAYHFSPDGSPDKWFSRSAAIGWAVVIQLFLIVVAIAIPWGTTKLSALAGQTEGAVIKPARTLSLMGNMIALPQIILLFAMLDIFSYNSYQTHLMPVWIFALIVMVIGGIILGVFFIQAVRRALRATQ
jgi:uncharacterized membrane protein